MGPCRRCAPVLLVALVVGSFPGGLGGQKAPVRQPSGVPDQAEATRLFKAGSAAFAAGDLTAAHSSFARLVKLVPRVAAAHAALGAVLLAENRPADALPELTEAHRLNPDDGQTALELAVAEGRSGHDAAAVAGFRALSPSLETTLRPPERLAYARALANTGDPASAEVQLQRAVESSEAASPELLDALGSVEAQEGRLVEAATHFAQALAAAPAFGSAHAHLGSVLRLQGQPAAAAAELQRAVQAGDNSLATEVELGRALSAAGRDAEAVSTLRHAVSRAPASPDAQYGLALALEAGGQSAEALPFFSHALAARPGDAEVLVNYGLALVQTGDAASALALYERAAALHPNTVALYQDMGAAYLQLNKLDQALEQFQGGLRSDPENPQLHYDLGLTYKLKDDLPRAVAELEKAEQLDPQLPDPPYTLGVLRMQQGNAAEAANQLTRAVTLTPGNGQAWSLLGSVQRDAGNLPAAAEALRHAAALEPDQPNTHVLLAAVLAASGDHEGAAAERKVAATLSRKAMDAQRAGFALRSGKALLIQGDVAGAVLQLTDAVAAAPDLKEAHLLLAEAFQKQGRKAEALAERQKAENLPPAK